MNDVSPAILLTIPLSHYCEKARWGLDRLAFPYRESAHAPLLHRIATGRRGGGSLPVLVHGRNRLINSTDILMYADAACGGDQLYPRHARTRRRVEELVDKFDSQLGPHSRRWAYAQLLEQSRLLNALWAQRVPKFEAMLISVVAPAVRHLVRASYKITPDASRRSIERVRRVFDEVGTTINDDGRFLIGDRFTAADLCFAALASPVLLPDQCQATQPRLSSLPAGMQEEILRLRDHAAGRFALRLFAAERTPN